MASSLNSLAYDQVPLGNEFELLMTEYYPPCTLSTTYIGAFERVSAFCERSVQLSGPIREEK